MVICGRGCSGRCVVVEGASCDAARIVRSWGCGSMSEEILKLNSN